VIATAGLAYMSDLELLDVASDAVRPNVKAVLRVEFEVVASRGLFAGERFDKLSEWKQRKVSDNFSPTPLGRVRATVVIVRAWNSTAAMCCARRIPAADDHGGTTRSGVEDDERPDAG